MILNELLDTVPAYAKDLKLNLSTLLQQQELNEQQIWGTVAALAIASRNPQVLQTLLAEAALHLSPQALEAAKIAVAVMGMNNIYYRFPAPGKKSEVCHSAGPPAHERSAQPRH
jgi:alkyl hydroperoxide reductase subunit D